MHKLRTKEVIELINEIEETVDVQNWVWNGIHVWPLVRINLGTSLDSMVPPKSKSTSNKLLHNLNGLFELISAFLVNRSIFGPPLKKADVLFVTYSKAKNVKVDGLWFDSYIDPLITILDKKGITYQTVEYDYDYVIKNPSFSPARFIQHHLFFNTLWAKVYERITKLDRKSLLCLEDINTVLCNYKLQGSIMSSKIIKKLACKIKIDANYFAKIIRKVKPRIVIGSNYYGMEMALNLACKRAGVKCVDLQHGVQGQYHRAYGSWIRVPERGYEVLPDVFAVWSTFEKSVIEKWAKNTSHQVVVLGNPMPFYTSRLKPNSKAHCIACNNDVINILITLQTNRSLSKLYESLLLNSHERFFWWIRKHPCMNMSEINRVKLQLNGFKKSSYNFDDASALMLYDLLPRMDVHITENSTVTTEAALLGVPTILTHLSGLDLYEREVNSGKAFFADEPDKILELIEILASQGEKPNTHTYDWEEFETNFLKILADNKVI